MARLPRLQRHHRRRGVPWWVLALAWCLVRPAAAAPAAPDLSALYDQIYQVKVVASSAGSKSAIGSGFQVSDDGLIITNYHVISGYVNAPDTHRIEYLDQTGQSGHLTLLDFDVVHDIALLRHPEADPGHFSVNPGAIRKGEVIYALGNPRDLGITLVFGAYNGMVEHSYDPQILFSGSLNPGMSGGPGLNAAGEVVGVNVATAGSQLSFLVPATEIVRLLAAGRQLAPAGYDAEIARQIRQWQHGRFDDLLARDWQKASLGQFEVLGEIRSDMQCWGSSNEDREEHPVELLRRGCNAGNRLFIESGLSTGQIHYAFEHTRSRTLPPYRFHRLLSQQALGADNQADKSAVTPYRCSSRFLDNADAGAGVFDRALYCVRAYKKLDGLFDVLFLAQRSADRESLSAHFTLAGVDQDIADAFTRKFLKELAWTSS